MKKAKIMLSAIAIFAIVGGALAFNAKRTAVAYYIAPDFGALPTLTLTHAITMPTTFSVRTYYTLTPTATAINYSVVTTTANQ
jgi:hypothetical protein